MSSKMLELNNEQAKAMSYMTSYLMTDSSDDKCKDILTIIAVGVFQEICDNRGYTDPRFCDEIIAEITNHVEYMLRDFNEYECDKLYGPDEEEKNVSAE